MTLDLAQLKDESLQGYPNGKGGALRMGGYSFRDALLPQWASRERERALREYYRHSNNTTFKSVVAGIAKRVVSTPYEVIAGRNTKMYCDNLLRYADMGSWERFVSKLVTDYSRQDVGAFVQIIAPGDPLKPFDGRPTGLSILDPLRCYLTGDPEYPVIYWNSWPKPTTETSKPYKVDTFHIMHYTRVRQFPDMPDSDEFGFGTGECALSRCIAPVYQEILMSRFIETMLDDKPQPGYRIFNNVTDAENIAAREKTADEAMMDNGGYGRVVDLFSLQPEYPVDVKYVSHSVAPPGFDYEAYTNLNAKKFAAGLNVDIQEFWELSGGGLGTATQSEVLAEKARGKFFGRILKGVERFLNDLLPDEAEFAFKYEDAQEDLQRAEIAEKYATVITLLSMDLTRDERRILLANQVEAIKDAITDEDGELQRFNDNDPAQLVDPTLETIDDASPAESPNLLGSGMQTIDDVTSTAQKAYGTTRADFVTEFAELIDSAKEGILPRRSAYVALRSQLRNNGVAIYLDGLRKGGVEASAPDEDGQTALATWLAEQSTYLRSFVDSLFDNPDSVNAAYKANEWANGSLDEMYYTGLAHAAPNKRFKWVYDPAKEHCDTCRQLHGQIHRMKDFSRYGLVPRSKKLICYGVNCGCKLEPTDEPITGRLRSVRYVRREHVH